MDDINTSPISLTHVAALLVGILVTYLVVGGGGSSSQKSSSQDRGIGIVDHETAGSTATKTAKKKAKKKKSKAATTATTTTATPEPEETTVAAAAAAASTLSAPTATAGGKKKKKKGKAGSSSAAATINNNSAPSKTDEKENKPKESSGKTNSATTLAASAPKKQQQQPKVQEEEEWTTIAETKKDKKKKRPVTTAPNPNSAAAAASTDTVTVDAKKIGIIIGPKGATLKGLEEATGCKLDVNAPSKDDSRATMASVTLTADKKEALVAAKKAIRELVSKGYATILQSENFGENYISVHPRYLNEIVGPSGQTIKALQTTLDVKITIPPTDWKPNTVQVGQVKMAKVGVAGSKEGIAQCKQAIQALMQYHHSEISHPGMIHQEVHVPSEFFHCIIGTRGSEIKHIKGNFKVQVYMPNEDSHTDNVLVVGKSNNVEKAIAYIQTLMDRDALQRETKYNDEYY
eukprot:scaffold2686_cov167-Amphora_coffeaeformis.AAC.1